jgi:hypothetical protein
MSNFAVTSECPWCRRDCLQEIYTREEVSHWLCIGAAIKAYCATCDEVWDLSADERAWISRLLNTGQRDTTDEAARKPTQPPLRLGP